MSYSPAPLSGAVVPWLRIARLQFYPMTFLAYTLGAVLARGRGVDAGVWAAGYAGLFVIELCTVLANEYFDQPADALNRNAGLYTGGSRVLVEKLLAPRAVLRALLLLAAGLAAYTAALLFIFPARTVLLLALLYAAGLFLGLGYTVPPLKFCYRGAGELVVGFTHSFYVILCGYLLHAAPGAGAIGRPLLFSLPLFFAVLAAIMLADIPDAASDKAAGKRTLAVILGPGKTTGLALLCLAAAAASGLPVFLTLKLPPLYAWTFFTLGSVHFLALAGAVLGLARGNLDRKIDLQLALSLSFVVWFGAVPLFALYSGRPPGGG